MYTTMHTQQAIY